MSKEIQVEIEGIGKVESFYLSDKDLYRIGESKPCNRCGELYIVGIAEVEKFKHDYKGRPKKNLELYNGSFIIDVDLSKNPIDMSKYNVREQAVIFGVEYVRTRFCPDCITKNHSDSDDNDYTVVRPKGSSHAE